MTPYQADVSGRALPAPTKEDKEEFESAPVVEPKKRESKKAAEAPVAKQSLDSVVKAWSDED